MALATENRLRDGTVHMRIGFARGRKVEGKEKGPDYGHNQLWQLGKPLGNEGATMIARG